MNKSLLASAVLLVLLIVGSKVACHSTMKTFSDNSFQKALEKVGMTELHFAVMQQNHKYLKKLIKQGADVNLPTKEGQSPLHIAASVNALTCAQILIDSGADINALDNHRNPPLSLAATVPNPQFVELLLKNNADTSLTNSKDQTPLEAARFALRQYERNATQHPDFDHIKQNFTQCITLLENHKPQDCETTDNASNK